MSKVHYSIVEIFQKIFELSGIEMSRTFSCVNGRVGSKDKINKTLFNIYMCVCVRVRVRACVCVVFITPKMY